MASYFAKLLRYSDVINTFYTFQLLLVAVFALLLFVYTIVTTSAFIGQSTNVLLLLVYFILIIMGSINLTTANAKHNCKFRVCLLLISAVFMTLSLTASETHILWDTFALNLFIFLQNLRILFIAKCEQKYSQFRPEFTQLYRNQFKDYLNRAQFAQLVQIGCVRHITENTVITRANDEVSQLRYVLKGKLKLQKRSEEDTHTVITEQIGGNDFVDSLEWIASNLSPNHNYRSQFTVKSVTKCVYIHWPKESLIQLLERDKYICKAVMNVLNKFVALKCIRKRGITHESSLDREVEEMCLEQIQIETVQPCLQLQLAKESAIVLNVPWATQITEPLIESMDYEYIRRNEPIFRLVYAEAFKQTQTFTNHIAASEHSWFSQSVLKDDISSFTLIIHLQIGAMKTALTFYHVLDVLDINSLYAGDEQVQSIVDSILHYDMDIKNKIKLVPRIVSGPFILKKMANSSGVNIDSKVKQTYFHGRNYFEIDVQCNVNASVAKLCNKFAKNIVFDMLWTANDELMDQSTERMLCAVRVHNLRFADCQ